MVDEDFFSSLESAYMDSFDLETMRKGMRLVSSGLVENVSITKYSIAARVRSERMPKKRYRVDIVIGDNYDDGDEWNFECDCPVGLECKHAAAVCLVTLNEGRRQAHSLAASGRMPGSDPGDRRGQTKDIRPIAISSGEPEPVVPAIPPSPETSPLLRPSEDSETIVKQGAATKSSLASLLVESVRPLGHVIGPNLANDIDRWRLVYCLGRVYDEYVFSSERARLKLFRALVYRKLSGEEGRIKKWSPVYEGMPVPPDAAPIENLFKSFRTEILPAEAVGLLLPLLRETALYISFSGDPSNGARAAVMDGSRAQLSFQPAAFERGIVRYEAQLRFAATEGWGRPVKSAFCSGGTTMYVSADAIYIVREGPLSKIGLAEALGLFEERSRNIPQEEAVALAEAIASSRNKDLEVLAPPRRVRLVKARPEAEAALEAVGEDHLRCSIRFSYRGADLGQDGKALLREGDSLSILERDRGFEASVVAFFRALAGASALPPNHRLPYDVDIAMGITGFAKELYEPISRAGFRLAVKTPSGRKAFAKGRIRASVSSGLDWFEARLRLDVDGEGKPLDGAVVFLGGDLFSAGGRVVAVDPRDKAALALLSRSRTAKDGAIRAGVSDLAAIAAMASLAEDDPGGLLAERAALFESLSGLAPLAPEKVPSSFLATLRPYQAMGFSWLMRLARSGLGGLLADDMGLGKTLQALAAIAALKEEGLLRPAVAVAPVTVISNWAGEAARFLPSLRVAIHWGQGRIRKKEGLDSVFASHDLVLTSYQTLRADIELFAGREYGLAILDEAHNVKNPNSAQAKAVRRLRARARISLTGTPVENRPMDLWSHFAFLSPGLLGGAKAFAGETERPIAQGDSEALAALRRTVSPFLLRRRKEEVLDDLPPKEEIVRYVDMGAAQASFYEGLRARCESSVGGEVARKGIKKSSIEVLEALLRLRQAAIHPGLISDEHLALGGAKVDEAATLVEELSAEGHRTLAFSQFTSALALLRGRLDAAGVAYEYLDGQTADRAERIARFQSGQGPGAFLLSLKAGGVGVNLTAADYVILLDPWWNPAVESQAIDRAHRIGQARKVTVYRLVARGTVEEKVLLLQDRKRRIVEELVSDSAGGLAGLSGEEILALFQA